MGLELESDGLSGGGSDGNFTAARGIATLDGLGIDGDGAHTHQEHLLVSSDRARHPPHAGPDGDAGDSGDA